MTLKIETIPSHLFEDINNVFIILPISTVESVRTQEWLCIKSTDVSLPNVEGIITDDDFMGSISWGLYAKHGLIKLCRAFIVRIYGTLGLPAKQRMLYRKLPFAKVEEL